MTSSHDIDRTTGMNKIILNQAEWSYIERGYFLCDPNFVMGDHFILQQSIPHAPTSQEDTRSQGNARRP